MPPVVLKSHHSLVGKSMLPVVRKLKNYNGETFPLARIRSTLSKEDMPLEEVIQSFRELTSENEKDIFEIADKEFTDCGMRILLHFAILLANDVGEPPGQDALVNTPVAPKATEMKDNTENILMRIDSDKTKIQESEVTKLKAKVRRLASQTEPSESLILLSLDELASAATEANHEDVEIYSEVAHQAHRNQGKIHLSNFVLGVLGGKAADIVSKAVSKSMKEKPDNKEDSNTSPNSSSLQEFHDAPGNRALTYNQRYIHYPPYPFMPFSY